MSARPAGHYDPWRGPFYREDLSAEDFLACYAERLGPSELERTGDGEETTGRIAQHSTTASPRWLAMHSAYAPFVLRCAYRCHLPR